MNWILQGRKMGTHEGSNPEHALQAREHSIFAESDDFRQFLIQPFSILGRNLGSSPVIPTGKAEIQSQGREPEPEPEPVKRPESGVHHAGGGLTNELNSALQGRTDKA